MMMPLTTGDMIAALLATCPSIGLAWQAHLAFWDGESDRGSFNDAGVIAQHFVDSFERGQVAEFPAAFALIERCLVEGDEQVRNVAVVGVLEGIQNIASHRPFGAQVFCRWLGPESSLAWRELDQFWQQVIEAKSAGLLEPRTREGT
jgi:hypothetical protein